MCPLTDDWYRRWDIYKIEYDSAIKKMKLLSFATTWMALKSIILNEISPMQKNKNSMISLTCKIQNWKQQTHKDKQNGGHQRGRVVGRTIWWQRRLDFAWSTHNGVYGCCSYTPDNYIMLLTKVTPINLILKNWI